MPNADPRSRRRPTDSYTHRAIESQIDELRTNLCVCSRCLVEPCTCLRIYRPHEDTDVCIKVIKRLLIWGYISSREYMLHLLLCNFKSKVDPVAAADMIVDLIDCIILTCPFVQSEISMYKLMLERIRLFYRETSICFSDDRLIKGFFLEHIFAGLQDGFNIRVCTSCIRKPTSITSIVLGHISCVCSDPRSPAESDAGPKHIKIYGATQNYLFVRFIAHLSCYMPTDPVKINTILERAVDICSRVLQHADAESIK